MAVKRLFIALTCTDAERAGLARDQAALLARVRKAHPTAAGNFHLTLAFLGMQDEGGERAAAEAVAAAARACEPVPLALGPLGTFHHRHGGDVVWRGVAATPELDRLQRTLVRELAQRGIELEARPFIGHITLARSVRANKDDDLDRLCAELTSQLLGKTASRSSDRLPGQPASEPPGRLPGQPASEPSDQLAGRPASEPSGPLSSRPAIEPPDQQPGKSTDGLSTRQHGGLADSTSGSRDDESANDSSSERIDKPANNPSARQFDKPANRSTTWPVSRRAGKFDPSSSTDSLIALRPSLAANLCDPASSGSASNPRPPATLHTDVSLMWSHRPESGALTYTPIATFALDGAAAS